MPQGKKVRYADMIRFSGGGEGAPVLAHHRAFLCATQYREVRDRPSDRLGAHTDGETGETPPPKTRRAHRAVTCQSPGSDPDCRAQA